MHINLELNELDLRSLILEHFKDQLGALGNKLTVDDICIEVKSKQNYKSEREKADFRAKITR